MKIVTSWVSRSWRDIGRIITVVGIGIVVMLFYNQVRDTKKIAQNTQNITIDTQNIIKQLDLNNPNSNLSKLKEDNHADHDIMLKYIQCLVNLSSKTAAGQRVTQADLDNCLAGTRLNETSPTPTTTPANNQTNNQQKTNETTSPKSLPNSDSQNQNPGVMGRVGNIFNKIITGVKGLL